MIYDAVIAGAGPAGAYLAYLLARAGLAVALFDKERFPREKVCGGGISKKTVDLLDFDISSIVHEAVSGALLTYQNRVAIIKDMPQAVGGTVVRSEFDNFLVTRAIAAGATFFPGEAFVAFDNRPDSIVVTTSARTLRGRRLCAADGVSSPVRNRVFGKGLVRYAPAVEALVRVPAREREKFAGRVLFDLGGMARGYGWIFPKRDHLNVGVYSIFGANNIRAELAQFMSRYRSLDRFEHISYAGYVIPLRNERNLYERERVWLLGDAAGFAESVYGEGIYFALKSATIASRVLKQYAFDPPIGSYARHVRREIASELRNSERIARAIYSFPKFAFDRIARSTHANEYFAGLIHGSVGYRECLLKAAATMPYWLWGKKFPYAAGLEL